MKTVPAIIAALGITAVVALGMLLIGTNALFNPNAGPVFNSPSTVQAAAPATAAPATPASAGASAGAASSAGATSPDAQQQIAQLQALVQQYQDREKQYQTELNQAAQKINQANQQASQANQTAQDYQNILMQLQQMGVISISANGQITVNRSRASNSGFPFGDGD